MIYFVFFTGTAEFSRSCLFEEGLVLTENQLKAMEKQKSVGVVKIKNLGYSEQYFGRI